MGATITAAFNAAMGNVNIATAALVTLVALVTGLTMIVGLLRK